jgi:hypothetical protein
MLTGLHERKVLSISDARQAASDLN